MKVPYEKIVKKLKEETNLDENTIELKVKEKQKELSGLVSKRGAAHIVANKLGVNLIEGLGEERLKIKNLVPGLKSIDIAGKVLRTWEPRQFEQKGGGKGEVGNFLVSDGTDKVKVVIWDKRTKWLKTGKLGTGDVVEVKGGYVKDSKFGLELHLRKDSQIDLNPDIELPDIKTKSKQGDKRRIKFEKVKQLKGGERARIRAALVSIFSGNMFYDACPKCMKKVRGGKCPEHGEVEEPEKRMILTAVFDDGTGTIRTTFFGKSAEILIGMETEEAWQTADEEGNQALINQKLPELLGKEMVLQGRVKDNKEYNRKDMIVNRVIKNPKPEIAINRLLEEKNLIDN